MKKHIAILGSTGSIGTQALEVIEAYPDLFELEAITAGSNAQLLVKQAIKFLPNHVVIASEDSYQYVKESLKDYPVKVFAGKNSIKQVVEMDSIQLVLAAMVGFSGLEPTINAILSGKDIALANKETMVVAGELITRLANECKVNILPVDSEHSAIFQCLAGEELNAIEKIYLTASGGPFLRKPKEYLRNAKKEEALKHPNWSMGNKITIDSATMMNKGLEVIEARWLFGLTPEQIEVLIHPQSIIHSVVQFEDGSMKAQMGLPNMKLPIQYALGYPKRIKSSLPRFNFLDYPNLTFEAPDLKIFRNLALAFEALRTGGNAPCVMNAANEIAVQAFLNDRIGFLDIPVVVEKTLDSIKFISHPELVSYIETDLEARNAARALIKEQL